MKQMLMSCTIAILVCFVLIGNSFAQCDKNITVYGFLPEGSADYGFGYIVAASGDVDNDNYADFMVAGKKSSFPSKIAVTVFSGLTGDSIATYYEDANAVYGMSEFGDYNNDNYDDILINGVVYSGLNGEVLFSFGGTSMRKGIGIGDANGDGKYDFLIPDYGWSSSLGRVDLLSGANGDTLQSWEGQGAGGQFGYSVASAGDFNNDGYADVVIGQPRVDISGSDRGRVYVYSGYNGSELFISNGKAAGQQFGYNVAGAGDLDNDGYDDILIAGQSENSINAPVKVWAYSGKTDSLIYTVSGESYQDKFGYAMDGVGDISNDGYDDFVVTAFRYASNKGNIYLFSGRDGTLLYESYNRYALRELLGASVAGLGDTDGDGNPDYVVGARWAVDPDVSSGSDYQGAAYVYRCFFPDPECQLLDDFDDDLWDDRCDNCQWFRNVYQEDSDGDGIGDICEDSALTYTGVNRNIQFTIGYEFGGAFTHLIYDNVTQAGYTYYSMTPLDESSGFEHRPWLNPLQYNFGTTALFTDSIEVTLDYIDIDMNDLQEQELQIFQKIDGYWRNITSMAPNTTFNQIKGRTTTLGAFLVGNCLSNPDIDEDGIGDFCDNCPSGYNPNQEDANANGIGDVCENSQTALAGSETSVSLNAADETVVVDFDLIDQEGDVELVISGNGPASGSNFTIFPSDPPKYYEISTNALFTGEISITLNYNDAGLTIEQENMIALWHYEADQWVDITYELNTAANYLIGRTSSLSPFVIGLADNQTDISGEFHGNLPQQFKLKQNYPNPFNPSTIIEFNLPRLSNVEIDVYNILGQKVRNLINDEKPAGHYSITWDGRDNSGKAVSSGIYFYKIKTDDFSSSKKMILLK